jgi:hypothetical protein
MSPERTVSCRMLSPQISGRKIDLLARHDCKAHYEGLNCYTSGKERALAFGLNTDQSA